MLTLIEIINNIYNCWKEIILNFFNLDGFYMCIFLFFFLPILMIWFYYFINKRYYNKFSLNLELFEKSITFLFVYDIFIALFNLTDFKIWCFLLNVQLTFIYGIPIIIFEFKMYWKRTPFFKKFFYLFLFIFIFILIRINSNLNSL